MKETRGEGGFFSGYSREEFTVDLVTSIVVFILIIVVSTMMFQFVISISLVMMAWMCLLLWFFQFVVARGWIVVPTEIKQTV